MGAAACCPFSNASKPASLFCMGDDLLAFGPHAELILRRRYLVRDADGRVCETPEQMLRRVACAVAVAEEKWHDATEVKRWADEFFALMAEGLFLPNSPTLMNAGRALGQLSACFVLPVEDSLESIFKAVGQTALIHKSGGGTGFSFSKLRPSGDVVATTMGVSSGPLSFMRVFDVATEAIKQGGTRRGANMGMLAVNHPDIELFITAKTGNQGLHNFNLSVMADDAFMAAAAAGDNWPLLSPRDGRVVRTVNAAGLLALIVDSAFAAGEPGLAFFDAINRANPTPALGQLMATNPCGEQPLLDYESCNLGSLVLPAFVRGGEVDLAALEKAAVTAVRFLDDVLEVNRFPLDEVAVATRRTRKIGLGVMGLADLLSELGLVYGSSESLDMCSQIMAAINNAARAASEELAYTRGSFGAFAQSIYPAQGYSRMRNATVTTIAPTGTLSLLMGCSASIEPHFALAYTRRVLDGEDLVEMHPGFLRVLGQAGLDTPANRKALAASGQAQSIAGLDPRLAACYPTAHQISPQDHLAVQAAFQAHVDNGVSKTVNLPASATPDQVAEVFTGAHTLGLKGVTVFRHGCRGRQVLELAPLPGQEISRASDAPGLCPRCGGTLATDGGCLTCLLCGASGCE